MLRLSAGLIVAFRELFDRSNRLLEAMATASFGAYILHPAIVVALQTAIADAAVVSVLGRQIAFGAAHVAGQVPGIRAVLAKLEQLAVGLRVSTGSGLAPGIADAGRGPRR